MVTTMVDVLAGGTDVLLTPQRDTLMDFNVTLSK